MQTTFKLFFSCLLCFSLVLLSGCGDGVPKLTPAEQAEVDEIMQGGTHIIDYYLGLQRGKEDIDANRIIKYCKYFIAKGADVNADPRYGFPLGMAAELGNVEIVKFLVSQGADVNARTPSGYRETPLHLVFESNRRSIEIVKFLVSKGADVNAKNGMGMTALHFAAHTGAFESVKFLISKGANANVRDGMGRTPLDLARNYGYTEIVNYLSDLK